MPGLSLDFSSLGKIGVGDVLGAGAGIMALGGGITGAIGAQEAGAAAAHADLANAAIAGGNAATDWRSYYLQKGNIDYRRNALEGRQRALYGGAGIDAGSGSPLDVMADTEQQFSNEALNLFYGARARAGEAGTQAAADVAAARSARQAADTKSSASILGGIGSALGIASKIFGFL